MQPDAAARLPVENQPTIVLSRRVRPGHEEEFAAWADAFGLAMAGFPGYVRCQVVAPLGDTQPEWIFVFTFDSAASLQSWVKSDVREQWLSRSRTMVLEEGPPRVLSGLETLFGLYSPVVAAPPPVWKVAVSVFLGLYPTSLVSALYITPHLASLPVPLRVLVSGILVVVLMTWAVMPIVTRLLRFWLYPSVANGRRPA